MAEYKLSYTAAEIDERLGKVDSVVLVTEQALTNEQKTQIRRNIDAGTPQVQVDWNQNDETATDYIKNRPFYEFAEAVVDTITVNNGDTLDFSVLDCGSEGDTITVIWDGVSYEKSICSCEWNSGRWGLTYYTIGNQSYLNDSSNTFEDTGEEYLIKQIDGSSETAISCDENSHTLSIIKQSLVKIDEKFLPYHVWNGSGSQALIFNDSNNIASGYSSHAEGYNTTASGYSSHAEGYNTTASGYSSHAEGFLTTASSSYSHAEGYDTIASSTIQHVQGKFNIEDVDADGNALNTYAHIVGNGANDLNRSNAHTLDWDGNAEFAGDVIANGCGGESPISLVEIAEKTAILDEVDLNKVVYYEEVTEETETDVIESLCFDQLSLSFDGATLYLKFGNTILSQVDVSTEIITCTGISLDRTKISVTDEYIGTEYTLTPTVLPDNCTQAVKWDANNASVASVSNGVVTLTGAGNATITVTCGNYSATCDVVVEPTVVDVDIINGIYNTGTGTVSYVNNSASAVTNPFMIKLDNTVDYTVSMNNTNYRIMIVGYNMTDTEADYYIDNVGTTETFNGTLTYWGGWKSADGTVHNIDQSSYSYLQVLINKADGSAITSTDLLTIKNDLVIKKIYGNSEVGISFGINASWNASNSEYTMTLGGHSARGYSKYNGRDAAIPVNPLTTYMVDFSGINDDNYIVGYQFAKSDGVKVSDGVGGWKDSQTFTFTTLDEVVGIFFNFKYGEAGTTTITEEMAEALTNVFTFEKVVE